MNVHTKKCKRSTNVIWSKLSRDALKWEEVFVFTRLMFLENRDNISWQVIVLFFWTSQPARSFFLFDIFFIEIMHAVCSAKLDISCSFAPFPKMAAGAAYLF